MSEPDDTGKYQVNNNETVQGQVIGDNPIVHQHFYATQDKAPSPTKPEHVRNVSATSSLSSKQRQNRERLLKRVRAIWIEGLLEQSLHRAAWIDLHLQEQPDALENPWHLQVQELDHMAHALPEGTNIVEVYDEADGELLILGEPGSGKTTLLLQLARTLLNRAEADERQPMPVVFNLSSWAQKKETLASWLVEELKMKYQVPHKIAQDWAKANQVLPLLDGLDEVSAEARMTCVQAITAYYAHSQSQIGTPLIVCCRSQQYQELSLHLPLSRAVSILPLTEKQIDEYLSSAQGQLEGLRQALHDDTELSALAHRPLMLSIFTLVYQGVNAKDFPAASSSHEQTLHAVFSSYVRRMLSRRGPLPPWMQKQFLPWLTFIAKQLHRHQQTVLVVEDLQPDWLAQKPQRLYQWSMILLLGLFFGLFFGPFYGLFYRLVGGHVYGLVGALFYGLVGALFYGLVGGQDNKIQPAEVITWLWKKARERLSFVLVVALVAGLVGALVVGLAVGLAVDLLYGLIGALVSGLFFGLFYGLFVGLVVGLVGGLSMKQLTERVHLSPNEGIWRSVKNGLRFTLFVGLFIGLFIRLVDGLFYGLFYGLFVGLSFGLFYGLSAFVQHFVLRIFLWRTNGLPWNLIPFLDEAAERLFLRKVGGSYIFVHRLLLEYFATLDKPASTESTSPASKM
jgi:hypothetical protein